MQMPTLFDPMQLGPLELPNRIWMAPLTRERAGTERVPNALTQVPQFENTKQVLERVSAF